MATLIPFFSIVSIAASLIGSPDGTGLNSVPTSTTAPTNNNNIQPQPTPKFCCVESSSHTENDFVERQAQSFASEDTMKNLPFTLGTRGSPSNSITQSTDEDSKTGSIFSLNSNKRTFIPSKVHRDTIHDETFIFSPHKISSSENQKDEKKRRDFLSKLASAALSAPLLTTHPRTAFAEVGEVITAEVFKREGNGFEYSFLPPIEFKSSNKPLKTHLDEINFSLEGVRGYQYGITVDPVRIDSLKQFGTPEQVAARVVDAEKNRDGITSVALYGTPSEDSETGMYAIDYVSDGKRGTKHFMTRIAVTNGKLFVLTAQVKEAEFTEREQEMLETVNTFRVKK